MCTTKGSVSNQPFPYSDHEAVTTHLRLKARTTADVVSESPNSSAGMLCSASVQTQSQRNTGTQLMRLHRTPKKLLSVTSLASFPVFRESGRAGRHCHGGSYGSQGGLALCWEDALHSNTHRGDGIGSALSGAGHRRRVLVGPGHRSAFPPRLFLHAGCVVRCHPADHLSALRLLHHGAEIPPGSWRPDEADCWQSASAAQGPSFGWARQRRGSQSSWGSRAKQFGPRKITLCPKCQHVLSWQHDYEL